MSGHIKLYVSGITCICPYTHASGFSSVLLILIGSKNDKVCA
jgi:hypothetical protein